MKILLLLMMASIALIACGTANEKNNELNGEWTLDSATVSPAYLTSFCGALNNGTRFVFDYNNHLTVYPDSADQKCEVYRYHNTGSELHLTEEDLVVVFPLTQVDSNHIVLRNTYVPYQRRVDDRSVDDMHEYSMFLSRK